MCSSTCASDALIGERKGGRGEGGGGAGWEKGGGGGEEKVFVCGIPSHPPSFIPRKRSHVGRCATGLLQSRLHSESRAMMLKPMRGGAARLPAFPCIVDSLRATQEHVARVSSRHVANFLRTRPQCAQKGKKGGRRGCRSLRNVFFVKVGEESHHSR